VSVAAVLLVTNVAVATSAGGATQVAKSGNVSVTFNYTGTMPQPVHSTLVIKLTGKVAYDHKVTSQWCADNCWPNFIARKQPVVHVLPLQVKSEPSVVLDLYTGGAHCCFIEQVYSFNTKTWTFQKFEHNFGDPGVRLVKLGFGGTDDFLSADDRFAYAFTDYAASGLPLQILSFSSGMFVNVTRSFPSLIAKDAAQWLQAFNAQAKGGYQDTTGLVAAWAADEDMLGHEALVTSFLAREAKAGHLNELLGTFEPSGSHYVAVLQKFLQKYGYTK
jgi:hypothetical protein